MKKIRYKCEALLLQSLFFFFGLLSVDRASGAGAFIGRTIGPRLAASRKALRNVSLAFPDMDKEEAQTIIKGMWENLGRVIAEYPHLDYIARNRVEIEGDETIHELIRKKSGAVFFSAHISNWEVLAPFLYHQFGQKLNITYRAPNNPDIERMLNKIRTLDGLLQGFPKSKEGGQRLLRATRDREMTGILIDQKYNEGIAVPFFGQQAMTNPIFAQLAQKYDVPLVPIQNIRLKGAHFKLVVHAPIDTGQPGREDNPEAGQIVKEAHQYLEDWIIQNPEQWLWLHRRWKSKKLSRSESN